MATRDLCAWVDRESCGTNGRSFRGNAIMVELYPISVFSTSPLEAKWSSSQLQITPSFACGEGELRDAWAR